MRARRGNLFGFLACVGLLAYAYYAQFVMHLEPCPLCIFQRIGVFVLGVIFLLATLHDPEAFGRRVYAVVLTLAALATIGIALRHLYIQSLPAGAVPACGASLDFMLKVFSLSEVLVKVLTGSEITSLRDFVGNYDFVGALKCLSAIAGRLGLRLE